MNKTDQTTDTDVIPKEEQEIIDPVTPDVKEDVSEEKNMRKGLMLKKKRMEQGLSLEAVHETTKIPMDALKAIEEDYTVGTLSPFYIRGFIKIYAKYLSVDVTEVLDDFQKEELPTVTKQEVDTDFEFKIKQAFKKYLTHQRRKQIATVFGGIIFCFLLFQLITFMTRVFRGRSTETSPTVQQEAVSAMTGTREAQTSRNREEAAMEQAPEPEPTPAVSRAQVPVPQPAIRQVPQPAAPPPVETVQKDIRLTVRALKGSWLRVKADDRTVFQSTLSKGAVETWQADENIVIRGKNIIHLEFELNGKMIGTLGRKNRKAKSVTFTKEGLTVTK